MKERIRPPQELEHVLDQLKDEYGIFETKQKGLMFAAAIGFALHRDEIDSARIENFGEGIRMQYFASQQDDGFIDAIAVANAGELKILDPEKQPERIELFERCAYLGLQEMQKHCFENRPDDPINGLLNLIDDVQNASTDALPGLDAVAEKIGDYL